jgi:toxin ParE1/3/4
VTEFRLSERAERDLIEIYSNTAETFGSYQAEAYHAGLERTFDLLASFPRIGRAMAEIAPRFRRFRF